ncbi:MAG: hypothetical protein AB7F21_01270 [Desulfuromonadales bacterium]|uniref:hypothetical protein n=1 Tax=Desulfuromonas sp. KJ2020 TaxID=2919173 RepID=UPI0003222E86|nr:hypothetical protein [Desulfuromonas sp. KJ2020]MCP3175614.1 hypothetical protein [Desulfuromonas sp. KJ2020]
MHQLKVILLAGMALMLAPLNLWGAEEGVTYRGRGDSAPIFSLASSQDRLFSYDRDFYGKHHLILTFFPAAFTPV